MSLSQLPLRIVSLPLKRSAVHYAAGKPAGARSDVFYYFETLPQAAGKKATWADWVTGKAGKAWTSMGEAPRDNWKSKIYVYGERLIARVDFEELALSGLDTSLVGQKLKEKVALVHPTFVDGSVMKGQFSAMVAGRKTVHRRGFWRWMIVLPVTVPFAAVPVIPNLPFFYAAWRAWSHYRAWKASEWLEVLVRDGGIEALAAEGLEGGYGCRDELDGDRLGELGFGTRFEREGARAIEQIINSAK